MSLKYKFLDLDGEQFLTVYVPGQAPLLASNETHGNFDELVELAKAGDESVADLFDVATAVTRAFADVVEGRVAVRGGVVFFDDDPVDNSITEAILRFHEQGENFAPLVKFYENVMANPQVESREQFYRYLQAYDLPIDDDGCVILYKGVYDNGDGSYGSTHSGHAFVNGVEYKNARIPNRIGDVVTMPRSEVDFDPNAACSSGLHSGTHGYARGYGNTLMYIRVNPRDVVSVPHDVSSQKVRVCRYEVIDFADRNAAYDRARWVDKAAAVVGTEKPNVETEVPVTRENIKVGDTVRRGSDPKAEQARNMEAGKNYTVEFVARPPVGDWLQVKGVNPKTGSWFSDLVKVENVENKRDTRENHKHQKRDAKGHFVKM